MGSKEGEKSYWNGWFTILITVLVCVIAVTQGYKLYTNDKPTNSSVTTQKLVNHPINQQKRHLNETSKLWFSLEGNKGLESYSMEDAE